jgi:3-hydroxyethyl bacteriochlorophyllide a dehydrogenase
MQTQAILFIGEQQVTLADATVPDPGPGEVIIETAFSCISPGTELRCLAGAQPDGLPFPFIPGYSLAGHVVERGADVDIAVGAPVFATGTIAADLPRMWGGHVRHALCRAADVIPVPPGIGLRAASCGHLAAIAYHGLRLARPQPHERVAVVGLGAIGQLAARLFAATGAQVVAADLAPTRVQRAQQAGITAFAPAAVDLAAGFRPYFPAGADVIVDATGAPQVLPQLIALAKDLTWDDALHTGARYVVQGSYPGDFAIPYQRAFRKELNFLLPRDMQPRDVRTVFDLLARGRLAVDDLSEPVHPADAPAVYAALRGARPDLITAAFDWAGSAAP